MGQRHFGDKTSYPQSFCYENREFKIPRRQGPRKSRLKSEFAFFQSLSRLLQLIYFVKCKRTLFEPNSQEPYSSSEKKKKLAVACLRPPQNEIRHFPVVVRPAVTATKSTKKRDSRVELLFCLFNLLLFWCSCCRRCRGILKALMS